MPANYLATIRYHVIDQCLRDRTRIWQWDDLAHVISVHLKEYHGMDKIPSKRTIMGDIAAMRSGVLGYYAPIVHNKTEGYRYAVPHFTIHQTIIPGSLMADVRESIHLIMQLTKNEKLSALSASLIRLKEYLHISNDKDGSPAIYFEHSLNEPGQKWLDTVYHYVRRKLTCRVGYLPFDGQQVSHVLAPAFIKEYNNRWYIFGYDFEMEKIINLALDRILTIEPSVRPYFLPADFDHDSWFEHLYGVTKPDDSIPVEIIFKTGKTLSNYMDTKPVHSSQEKLSFDKDTSVYRIRVYDNYEIRSKLRSFGRDLEVVEGLEDL